MADVWTQLVGLLVAHQQELVIILTAWTVAQLAKRFPAFAGLGNVAKRAVLVVVALLVSVIVSLVGGESAIDLGNLLAGGGTAAFAAGGVFKIARTTPTTADAATHLKTYGSLPGGTGGGADPRLLYWVASGAGAMALLLSAIVLVLW